MSALLAALLTTSPVDPGCGPLLDAVEAGDVARTLGALAAGDVDQAGEGRCARRTPLLLAAERGHLELVEALLARGADVDFTVVDRRSALPGRVTAECLARANGHQAVAALLRRRGAHDTTDGCRGRALLVAALRAADAAQLGEARRAGYRLALEQVREALTATDCGARAAYCIELSLHLPSEPSVERDRVLSRFWARVHTAPALRRTLPLPGKR